MDRLTCFFHDVFYQRETVAWKMLGSVPSARHHSHLQEPPNHMQHDAAAVRWTSYRQKNTKANNLLGTWTAVYRYMFISSKFFASTQVSNQLLQLPMFHLRISPLKQRFPLGKLPWRHQPGLPNLATLPSDRVLVSMPRNGRIFPFATNHWSLPIEPGSL